MTRIIRFYNLPNKWDQLSEPIDLKQGLELVHNLSEKMLDGSYVGFVDEDGERVQFTKARDWRDRSSLEITNPLMDPKEWTGFDVRAKGVTEPESLIALTSFFEGYVFLRRFLKTMPHSLDDNRNSRLRQEQLDLTKRLVEDVAEGEEDEEGNHSVVRERETITRDVVMIPCGACGKLMERTSVSCPHCGRKVQAR